MLENPVPRLPRLTDRRREERPYGWALSAYNASQQEAWLLGQELWQIDGLVWAGLGGLAQERKPAVLLLSYGYSQTYRTGFNPVSVLKALGASVTLLTNLGRGPEQDFVRERDLLARLTELGALLRALEAIYALPTPDITFGTVSETFQRLAEQELSLRQAPLAHATPLSLAPERPGRLTPEEASVLLADMRGWWQAAQSAFGTHLQGIDPWLLRVFPVGPTIPAALSIPLWQGGLENELLVHPAPISQTPVNLWHYDLAAWASRSLTIAMPVLVRLALVDPLRNRPASLRDSSSGFFALHAPLTLLPTTERSQVAFAKGRDEATASLEDAQRAPMP